jgi:hypothetical protein
MRDEPIPSVTIPLVDAFDPQPQDDSLPLRDRLPDYAIVFAVGIAACAVIGFVIWAISDVVLSSAIGYTIILYGVILMLAGGASGGGYTNLGVGAVGALFGTRRADEAQDEIDEAWNGKHRVSPQDRLRAGLRPEANPRAFWQVSGGLINVAVGLFIVIIGS